MENKENLWKSEVQCWSITSISIRNLPEQLKSPKNLNRIYNMDACHDDVDTYDYCNWKVFELGWEVNPDKYVKYSWLHEILLDMESNWSDEKLLILQKETTKKYREKDDKFSDMLSKLCDALFRTLKESKSKSEFYDKCLKYRDEIASAIGYGGENALGLVKTLWEIADELWKWETTIQDLDDFMESTKQTIQLSKFLPPPDNRIFYMQWSKEKIKKLRKKFLENWSNVFIVS